MVEVTVAAIVFALTAAGIFATVSAIRQPAGDTTREITAAFVGGQILESLRNEVDASTWNLSGFPLSTSPSSHSITPVTVGNITYSGTYTVLPDPQGTGARKVTLNITW